MIITGDARWTGELQYTLSVDGSATKHGSLGVTLDMENLDESQLKKAILRGEERTRRKACEATKEHRS